MTDQAVSGPESGPGYSEERDPAVEPGFSGWAIAAFLSGLVIPLIGIVVAIPLGIVALVKVSKTGDKGKGIAIAGMALSVAWWLVIIGLSLWVNSQQVHRDSAGVIDQSGPIGYTDIKVGDCISLGYLGSGNSSFDTSRLTGVPCSDSHNAQVVAMPPFTGTSYPGAAAIGKQTQTACAVTYAKYPAPYIGYSLFPTESLWGKAGGHHAICFITKSGGQPMTGSVLK